MSDPDTIPKPESHDPATAGGGRRPSSCSPSSGPIVINGLTCLQIGYLLDGGTITIETDLGNFYRHKTDKKWRYQESHIVLGNTNTVADLERMLEENAASGYKRGLGRFKANENGEKPRTESAESTRGL